MYKLKDKIDKKGLIFDPCVGKGSLLLPWKRAGYQIAGIDLEVISDINNNDCFILGNFFNLSENSVKFLAKQFSNLPKEEKNPTLILCNPPFNGMKPKLAPEVWLDKIIELFGKEIPLVLFAPMGFRLNGKKQSKRWSKFIDNKYPPISSIISLPRDIFPEVEFHSEILIFNIKGLQSHYFYEKP